MTHLLLATLIASPLHARLSLLVVIEVGMVVDIAANATGAAVQTCHAAPLPLRTAIAGAHGTRRTEGISPASTDQGRTVHAGKTAGRARGSNGTGGKELEGRWLVILLVLRTQAGRCRDRLRSIVDRDM
jgi:hypothetical protein